MQALSKLIRVLSTGQANVCVGVCVCVVFSVMHSGLCHSRQLVFLDFCERSWLVEKAHTTHTHTNTHPHVPLWIWIHQCSRCKSCTFVKILQIVAALPDQAVIGSCFYMAIFKNHPIYNIPYMGWVFTLTLYVSQVVQTVLCTVDSIFQLFYFTKQTFSSSMYRVWYRCWKCLNFGIYKV